MPQGANYIWELNPNLPLGSDPKSQGDDYFRQLARSLIGDGIDPTTGSFTTDFTGQYTGTATELNKINNPASIGMTLGNLSNVTLTDVQTGDTLRATSPGLWENLRPSIGEYAFYQGWGSPERQGDAVIFANEIEDGLDTAIGTFTATDDGFGSKYVAAVDHKVTFSMTLGVAKTANITDLYVIGAIGYGTGSGFPTSANMLSQQSVNHVSATAGDLIMQISWAGIARAGRVYRFYWKETTDTSGQPGLYSFTLANIHVAQDYV